MKINNKILMGISLGFLISLVSVLNGCASTQQSQLTPGSEVSISDEQAQADSQNEVVDQPINGTEDSEDNEDLSSQESSDQNSDKSIVGWEDKNENDQEDKSSDNSQSEQQVDQKELAQSDISNTGEYSNSTLPNEQKNNQEDKYEESTDETLPTADTEMLTNAQNSEENTSDSVENFQQQNEDMTNDPSESYELATNSPAVPVSSNPYEPTKSVISNSDDTESTPIPSEPQEMKEVEPDQNLGMFAEEDIPSTPVTEQDSAQNNESMPKTKEPVTTDDNKINSETRQKAEETMTQISDEDSKKYVVKPGDTLESISQKIYHSKKKWKYLAEKNSISNPDFILPGDVIVYESNEKTSDFNKIYETSARKTVVVKSGDTLTKISEKLFGNTFFWKNIWKLNSDIIKDPNKIYSGQKLTYVDPRILEEELHKLSGSN